jgi:bacillithiol synthase
MTTSPKESDCIDAIDLPETTRLYADYVRNFPSVSDYFAHPPNFEFVRRAADQASAADETLRTRVVEILRAENRRFGADASVENSLDRLEAGAVAVVTGQQVGLFSGPSYTIYKALTAQRLAEDLTASGKPAVAVFWLASEDHDLAEVNHCFWPSRTSVARLELPAADPRGRRVGEVPLGQPVRDLIRRARETLQGPGGEEVIRAMEESYRDSETYGSAFGKLLARILAGRGLILLDPLSAELHRLAAPQFQAALEQHADLARELVARSKALEQSGYHAQVKVTERSTMLFVSVDGERLPLRTRNGEFVLGRQSFSKEQLSDLLARTPEIFSPNVLLRPIIQDTLLPTAAYVAGPSEVAYFAQASAAYRRLLGRMPVIVPRASFTLVDSHVARLLRRYKLEPCDVLRGRLHLRSRMEQALLPRTLERRFGTGEKALRKILAGLRGPVGDLDQTLIGTLDTAERKMLYQFGKLRGKAARAMAFRSAVIDVHENEITALLQPNGGLQERSLCLLPTLAAHGTALLDRLAERITPGASQHQFVYL